jgi:hypothetical protein
LDSGRRWPRHPRPIDFVHCYLFALLPGSFPAGPPALRLLSYCGMPSRAVEDFPSCPIPASLRASAPLRTSFHRLRRKTLLPYTTVITGFRAPAHLPSLLAEEDSSYLIAGTVTQLVNDPWNSRQLTTPERPLDAPYHLPSGANAPQ